MTDTLHTIRTFFRDALIDISTLDEQVILFAGFLVIAVVLFELFFSLARKGEKETGVQVQVKGEAFGVDGSAFLPVREYISDMQGIAGRPDALIRENGEIIPIERKPLSKKIHDRHVAQLLVYMRLVEEFEGKRPPYGYLVLGSNSRKVKIENTPQRQQWLQKILDEMRAILQEEKSAVPSPHPRKCRNCDVNKWCTSSLAEKNGSGGNGSSHEGHA